MSFLALKSNTTADDRQWLTYWITFGTIYLIDVLVGGALEKFPFFYCFKLVFFLYLMHPSYRGATKIYNRFILPIMSDFDPKIKQIKQAK